LPRTGLNRQTTAQTSYSALQSDLGATFGDTNRAGFAAALVSTATKLTVTGASFTLDRAVTTGVCAHPASLAPTSGGGGTGGGPTILPTRVGSTGLIWASHTAGFLIDTTTYGARGFEMMVTPDFGSGVLCVDPRFDRIFVCFSSGCHSVN
jgi:hypothetical protein